MKNIIWNPNPGTWLGAGEPSLRPAEEPPMKERGKGPLRKDQID